MTSVGSLSTFSNSSGAPIVAFLDVEREYLAKPRVTYLYAASARRHALDDMSAHEVHRAVSGISGVYGEVFETADRMEQTLRRKLGIGKNAVG